MYSIGIAILLQSLLLLPPRTAMENPATLSQVPPKIAKDYDKLWLRFVTGREDAKLKRDLDSFALKQKTFGPAVTLQAYLSLYSGDYATAVQRFNQALTLDAKNSIAVYYLAEIAYIQQDYARAAALYTRLLPLDSRRPDIETKRQRALLLATDATLRSGARAEAENRLVDAEQAYRQALTVLPNEPSLHQRLADLLARENKNDEAAVERRAAEALMPARGRSGGPGRAVGSDPGNADTIDDIGRWGGDLARFHEIRNAPSLTREQLAVLLVRYFPQITELRQTSQILTDIQSSWATSEIQVVTSVGLMNPLPNHTFGPSTTVTRGEFAATIARLMRMLGMSAGTSRPVPASDLSPGSAIYPEVQLVLSSGVMTLADSGSFSVSGDISGREAVNSAERALGVFQQAPH
jgi:tetratricopeptide (TPR) repeat protein